MLGAILGDIVGSPFEFDHNNYKHKDFPLLSEKSHFTDDTVMTVAVARGLMEGQGDAQKTFAEVQHEMRSPSAVTATPWPASPAALPKPFMECRRSCSRKP